MGPIALFVLMFLATLAVYGASLKNGTPCKWWSFWFALISLPMLVIFSIKCYELTGSNTKCILFGAFSFGISAIAAVDCGFFNPNTAEKNSDAKIQATFRILLSAAFLITSIYMLSGVPVIYIK